MRFLYIFKLFAILYSMTFKSKYYFIVAIAFVTFLMISNTVATKIVSLFGFTLPGSVILFPFTYIFGDILTEVYGYHGSRPIIWAGFSASIIMALSYALVQHLPPAPVWKNQEAFELILGITPRIVLGSLVAYIIGEFANSFVISKMKVLTKGRYLWARVVGSTVIGQALDSTVFILIAFGGIIASKDIVPIIISAYIAKVIVEIVMTPLTYKIVSFLKKKENLDTYDHDISYNPFTF